MLHITPCITLYHLVSGVDILAARARPHLLRPPRQGPFQCLHTDSFKQDLVVLSSCVSSPHLLCTFASFITLTQKADCLWPLSRRSRPYFQQRCCLGEFARLELAAHCQLVCLLFRYLALQHVLDSRSI